MVFLFVAVGKLVFGWLLGHPVFRSLVCIYASFLGSRCGSLATVMETLKLCLSTSPTTYSGEFETSPRVARLHADISTRHATPGYVGKPRHRLSNPSQRRRTPMHRMRQATLTARLRRLISNPPQRREDILAMHKLSMSKGERQARASRLRHLGRPWREPQV